MAEPKKTRVACKGRKKDSFLAVLARHLEGVTREGDAAAARVLRGEGRLSDLLAVQRAERVAKFVTH